MASPFSVFRKRQKLMMALLCLLAIVAFVFLPVLSDLIGGREKGPAVHAAVETAKYGKLYEWDLERMRRQRQQVLAVLDDLATQAEISPYLTQYRLQSMFGPANDVSVVNSWLLARRAEELGMVISDDTINAFLREWTNRAVPRAEILKTFQKAGLKTEQFFAMLREELLAKQLWETFQSSLGAATPAQRWDYFNRVHCSATLEAIPIAVASFVQQIDDPPEAELKEFFEKSKHRIPNPESPDPGFRKPHRVELHYLKAEIEKFSAPTMITDAEIEEYYQKNKEAYDKAYKPSPKETDSDSKDADAKTHAADVQQEKKSAEDSQETTKDSAKASNDAKDAKEKTGQEAKKTGETTEKRDGSSAFKQPSPFRLTAMLQDAKDTSKDAQDAQKEEAKEESKEEPKEEAKEESKPAASEDAAKAEPPAKPEEANTDEKTADAGKGKTDEKPKDDGGMTDAMRDAIRRDLALEKIQKVFERIREPMDKYRQQRSVYDAQLIRAQSGKGAKPVGPAPAPPDIDAFAKENGLTAVRTGLVSQWGIRDTEIAASQVEGRLPVLQYAFQSLSKYRPAISADAKALYFFWKTEDEKERTPKFDEPGVREEALRQWKRIQARRPALQRAETLAAEARKADKPLKLVFADRPDVRVILPPPFTWVTMGSVAAGMGAAPEISKVSGIESAGEEFMKTVFRLRPNEVGTAFNAPQTIVYVVRPTEFTPDYSERWKQFQSEPFVRYAAVAQMDQNAVVRAWFDEIKRDAGFQWAEGRDPELLVEREREE